MFGIGASARWPVPGVCFRPHDQTFDKDVRPAAFGRFRPAVLTGQIRIGRAYSRGEFIDQLGASSVFRALDAQTVVVV